MLAKWDEMALVGRIARAHGIRGQVIVNPETDFPEQRFQPGAELFVNRAGVVEPVLVTTVRFHRERPVIGLRGIDDMNAANGGWKRTVGAGRASGLAPPGPLPARSGRAVETREGGPVGVVTDVEGRMGGSRLVVEAPRGEVLVPFVVAICTTIDPAGKRIVIDPPEGLLEVNDRLSAVSGSQLKS